MPSKHDPLLPGLLELLDALEAHTAIENCDGTLLNSDKSLAEADTRTVSLVKDIIRIMAVQLADLSPPELKDVLGAHNHLLVYLNGEIRIVIQRSYVIAFQY